MSKKIDIIVSPKITISIEDRRYIGRKTKHETNLDAQSDYDASSENKIDLHNICTSTQNKIKKDDKIKKIPKEQIIKNSDNDNDSNNSNDPTIKIMMGKKDGLKNKLVFYVPCKLKNDEIY